MRVLVVGSGAREHSIVKKLKSSRYDPEVYCYSTFKNPGILPFVSAYVVGDDICDFANIHKFCRSFDIDFVIVGPEKPLVEGITDYLESRGIRVLGPTKKLAKLEGSKSFARNVLSKYGLKQANPMFKEWTPTPKSPKKDPKSAHRVGMNARFDELCRNNFSRIEPEVRHFAEQILEGNFVVKADGLAGGKGVKVSGQHFDTVESGVALAKDLYKQSKPFVIEEKLVGQEFSLISFCDGSTVIHSPPIVDYKRRYEFDMGPNCGSMGSVMTDFDFLDYETLETAKAINQHIVTVSKFLDNGKGFIGWLYGSYIKTETSLKVIEFNTRLGDPEGILVLDSLNTDFMDVCLGMLTGNLEKFVVEFDLTPRKCVYVVPERYPILREKGIPVDLQSLNLNGSEVFVAGLELESESNTSHSSNVKVQYVETYRGVTVNATEIREDGLRRSESFIDSNIIGDTSEEECESVEMKIIEQHKSNLLTTGSRAFCMLMSGKDVTKPVQIECKGLSYRTDIGDAFFKNSKEFISYKEAGVDIDAGNQAVRDIKSLVEATYTSSVISNPGGFGGMITTPKGEILVSSTDSVGSKSEFCKKYAKAAGLSLDDVYSNLGRDIVNHCVNDILVQSPLTQPLHFLDYFATNSLQGDVLRAFVKGVSDAAQKSGCVLIGGETAEIPAIYKEGAVDLVGSITGTIPSQDDILAPKKTIKAGDRVFALPSVSPHTNGYTLLAKLIEESIRVCDFTYVGNLIDWMRPHKCYLEDVRRVHKCYGNNLKGLCHITGGGLIDNPPRILPDELEIEWNEEAMEKIQPEWMKWIIDRAGPQSRRVFNCGIGMLFVVDRISEDILVKGTIEIGVVREKKVE